MNPFEILEIAPGATPDEIKDAYHRLAKQWHPDRFSGAEKAAAEERFRNLSDAFNMLKDPNRRSEVDARAQSSQAGAPKEAAKPVAERSVEDWYQDAKEAMAAKDYSRAMGLVHYTIRLDPNHPEAYGLLAQLIEATHGDKRTLVKALENAIRLKPKDVESMIRLADTFQELGMQAKATRLREEAFKIAPTHKLFRKPAAPKTQAKGSVPEGGLVAQFQELLGRFLRKG